MNINFPANQLFYWLLFWSSLAATAQSSENGTLKGKVYDKTSGEPLEGASVKIEETGLGTISDQNGLYAFQGIKPGKYTLRISYAGYLELILANQSVLEGKTRHTDAYLEERDQVLKEAEVGVFRYENNKTKPISTFSFTRDEIAANPGAQGDIFRAIGMLPGVSSSGGIYSAIAVRGQGVRDNVYMVDDIPLTEVGHLEGNSFFNDPNGGRFSIFAPRVIDHAVFQGGAFGTEFGRRSASYLGLSIKEGNRGSAIYDGQLDLLGLTINYDGPSSFHKNTSLFISARYQNFLPLVKLIGLENLGLPSYSDVIVKSSTEINSKNKLNLLFMVCPERFVRNMDNLYADKALNLLYLPDFRRNKIIAGVHLKTRVNENIQWKNIIYFTNYSSDVNVGKAYPTPDSSGRINIQMIPYQPVIQTQTYLENKWGMRSILEATLSSKSRIIIGIEADLTHLYNDRALLINDTNYVFRRQQLFVPGQNFQPITPELVNADFDEMAPNASVFLNYFFELGKRISGQAGFRADYSGFSEQLVLAPRVSLSYALHSNHSLSLGGGWYWQDPVYSDIADLGSGSTLKMEQIVQLIFSYKGYLRKDLKIMAEAWLKQFDNMVVSPVNGSVLRNNKGTGYGQGFDLSLTRRLSSKWHGIASYSFMEVYRNDHDGLGYYPFAFSQPHQLNIMMSYELNQKWSFSGKYRYATGRPTDRFIIHPNVLNNEDYYLYGMELIGRNEGRLPYFSSLDLRMNYAFHFKNVKFIAFFDVVNVLNRQIANSEGFNPLFGTTYYDGLAIFPTGGLKFEF